MEENGRKKAEEGQKKAEEDQRTMERQFRLEDVDWVDWAPLI